MSSLVLHRTRFDGTKANRSYRSDKWLHDDVKITDAANIFYWEPTNVLISRIHNRSRCNPLRQCADAAPAFASNARADVSITATYSRYLTHRPGPFCVRMKLEHSGALASSRQPRWPEEKVCLVIGGSHVPLVNTLLQHKFLDDVVGIRPRVHVG